MHSILIVDDDVELSEMLVEYLETEGFGADITHDGESGAEMAINRGYEVIVLDVMLPKLNGFETLRQIRNKSSVPVLMLTARGDEIDRIVGLEMGADDYLAKPFNPRELVARLRAILRRSQQINSNPEFAGSADIIQVGDIEIHTAARLVKYLNEIIDLTSTEYNLLEILVRHAGQVVTKETLSEQAIGRKLTNYDRSIDMHISNIRRKLEPDAKSQSLIRTVRGIGYQYTGV